MPQDFFPYSHKFSTVYKFILIRIKIYGNTYINLVPSGCPKIGKFRRPGNLPRSSPREGVQTTCTPIIMISVQASSPSLGEGWGGCFPPPLEGAGGRLPTSPPFLLSRRSSSGYLFPVPCGCDVCRRCRRWPSRWVRLRWSGG